MKEDLMLLRTMPWKHKSILAMVLMSGTILMYFTCSSQAMMIKSMLLYLALTFVSYLDYRFRIIPDWVHMVIIVVGIINFSITKSMIGLVVSPLPFLIMALIKEGSIGGGDIKLIGATGFAMGYSKTFTSSIIAMALAILFCSLYYLGKKKARDQSFPFAPFFQIGCTIVMITGGL